MRLWRLANISAVILLLIASPALAADRPAARSAMNAGVASLYSGNPHGAREKLQAAIAADPAWSLPRAVQARVLLALGDGAGAQTEIDRATALGMREDQLRHLAAHAALITGNARRAYALGAVDGLPTTSSAYAARIAARAAASLGDHNEAKAKFDAAIKLAPQSAQLWADIARYERDRGNEDSAFAAARAAVNYGARTIDALMLMGEMTRSRRGLIAAIPWFERAAAADPANVGAMSELAATLGDAGRANAMLAVTRRMLAADPENARAYYLQAVLAARAGNYDLARSIMYRTKARIDGTPGVMLLQSVLDLQADNAEAAIARLTDLIKLQPANLRVRQLLGAALWRAGDAQSAIGVLRPLAIRPDADSYTLSVIGRAYEAMGNRDAAALFLDRAAEPTRPSPMPFDLGTGMARAGADGDAGAALAVPRIAWLINNGQAGAALTQAVQLQLQNPGVAAAHVVTGDTYMSLDRPDEAAASFRRAAAIRFGEPVALRLIAALQQSGRASEAVRVLDSFLAQNPRSVAALMLAADQFMATGGWERATDTLEAIRARIGNRDAALLNNLGWAWFNHRDPAKALRYARAAYALSPANPAVANGYGWIMFKTGKDRKTAVHLLGKAAAIAPNHPGLAYQLAQALIADGQRAAARRPLSVASEDQEFPEQAAAAKLLAGL